MVLHKAIITMCKSCTSQATQSSSESLSEAPLIFLEFSVNCEKETHEYVSITNTHLRSSKLVLVGSFEVQNRAIERSYAGFQNALRLT